MNKKIKILCGIIIAVIFIAAIVVPFLNKDKILNDDENDNIVVKTESVNLVLIEPDFMNPLISKNKYVQEISKLSFEGLTELNDKLKPEMVLAKTIFPDITLTEWDIKLKENVIFHDGSNFTADDVIFTINKIKELEDISYFAYNVSNIKNVEKISEYEIKIKLSNPDNFFMSKITFPILSKKYYSNQDLQFVKNYIGTGPYKQENITDTNMKLTSFDNYHKETEGNIKDINVNITTKTRPGFELLKLGEIDFADTNTEVGAYGRSAYNSSKYVTSVFEGVIFNQDNEALKDTNVREAILLGINRDLIIENYVGGYGTSVDLPINPNSYLVNEKISKKSFNPSRSKDILNNNGWSDNNALGFRNKGALKLQFNLLVNSDSKNSLEKAIFIKDNLQNIGININIVSKSTDLYNLDISEKKYDMALTNWAISEYPEFLYNFETNSKNNIFGFSNKDYDYYVFMAKSEFLEGKSKEYFDKMQEILDKELPIIGMYFETSTVYYNQNIDGKLKPTINNIYSGIENMMKINLNISVNDF